MDNFYQEFNTFQKDFYTNPNKFSKYSKYDIKRFSYILLNSMAKGYPSLVNKFIKLYGINWNSIDCKPLLIALQRNYFCNGLIKSKIPECVYYKNNKQSKETKNKKTNKGIIFKDEIKLEIQNILFLDNKSYEEDLFTEKVQILGKQLLGDILIKKSKNGK